MLRIGFLMLLTLGLLASNASAVTIKTSFVGGTAPKNIAGAGNIVDVFNAAAQVWEHACQDPFTLTLYFGWDTLDSAGTHAILEQNDGVNRETAGIVLFDNSGNVTFYLDPTPLENEEYDQMREESQDLGGGMINVARIFKGSKGDAVDHVDLFSVAIHEIGHALGMSIASPRFIAESSKGFLNVSGSLPFAGTSIPLAVNNSGVTSHFDVLRIAYGSVMAGLCSDERRIPSSLDILAIAQISGFRSVNLDPEPAPQLAPPPIRPVYSSYGRTMP